ncbi:hypothetical protein KCP70_06050 [Salmonella enterica subsp. enterica]|nr:hypothetical protein KCP70_06050 [Salmonella enterica subsp. enterica]
MRGLPVRAKNPALALNLTGRRWDRSSIWVYEGSVFGRDGRFVDRASWRAFALCRGRCV